MYPEHKPLHTSRSDDTILSLLGHTLRLKRFFFFGLFWVTHQSPFYPTLLVKVNPAAQRWNTASAPETTSRYLLCVTHQDSHILSGGSCSSGVLPNSAVCQVAPLGMAGHQRASPHPTGQPATPYLWCKVDACESFSISTLRMLNLSGLTTVISGSYFGVTFTWSHAAVRVRKELNY